MTSATMAAAPDRDRFLRELVAWLNARNVADGKRIAAETPLFADGRFDSIVILRLLEWTERALGVRIRDEQIRLDNFRSAQRIADVFVGGA